eukprot:663143-Rhodomonas_salina.5
MARTVPRPESDTSNLRVSHRVVTAQKDSGDATCIRQRGCERFELDRISRYGVRFRAEVERVGVGKRERSADDHAGSERLHGKHASIAHAGSDRFPETRLRVNACDAVVKLPAGRLEKAADVEVFAENSQGLNRPLNPAPRSYSSKSTSEMVDR